METKELISEVRRKILDLRSIENLLSNSDTTRLTDTQRNKLRRLVRRGDREGVKDLLLYRQGRCLDELMQWELRELARLAGIKYYTRKSRGELVFELEKVNEEKKAKSTAVNSAVGSTR